MGWKYAGFDAVTQKDVAENFGLAEVNTEFGEERVDEPVRERPGAGRN